MEENETGTYLCWAKLSWAQMPAPSFRDKVVCSTVPIMRHHRPRERRKHRTRLPSHYDSDRSFETSRSRRLCPARQTVSSVM
jgi:hypothetical protein